MASQLTAHLKDCSENDKDLDALNAQWAFDRKLTGKALQNVGLLFPHYSRHDESHSIQILTNIERVLGPLRISTLSASDTWLLLEAAYHHDIGMVVTNEQKKGDWGSKDFRRFIEKQKKFSTGNSKKLIEHILKNSDAVPSINFDPELHPLTSITTAEQLLAEFYRDRHPDRAEQIISAPEDLIGLTSPRTELIPKRLFDLLGEICKVHGKGYDALMSLPHIASGMGRDLIHPRFIACMLRLGDLLDLDNNRFCPVMLKVVGEIPATSHAHVEKHHAVKHFRVDSERIEVTAICSSYEGYVATEAWFDYLRQEVAWQMAHWADIVPNKDFGLLPTIGKIETELRDYELIDSKNRPRFKLDEQKVFALLQGAGIYDSAKDILRELIQNAIDATLLLIWLRHGKGEADDLPNEQQIDINDSPFSPHVKKIFTEYPLQIDLTKEKVANGEIITAISIKDFGIGISREDLAIMAQVGGSYQKSWKQEIVNRMPKWMRPSGAFGIGLQSAFLLTNQLIYNTHWLLRF
jgi:hypothetical protein